jgi:hypothetical protein
MNTSVRRSSTRPLRVRQLVAYLFAVILMAPAQGQDGVIPDTLDWRGYYPLQIGNAWEWRTEQMYAYERIDWREIVGDTLIADTTYFVQETSFWEIDHNREGSEQAGAWSVLLRYEDTRHRVVGRMSDGSEHPFSCDLSADFGATGHFCDEWTQVVRSDWPEEGSSILGRHVPAAKSFWAWQGFGPTATYYHGIGPIPHPGDGNTGSILFTYLKLGGVEYGRRSMNSEDDDRELSDGQRIPLYPNPTSDGFTLEIPGPIGRGTIDIYDGTGRIVSRKDCAAARCWIDTSGLPAGGYFVRTHSRSGQPFITHVIVVR